MIEFKFKASSRLICQIGAIERFSGRWERIAESQAVASKELRANALLMGVEGAFALDPSSRESSETLIQTQKNKQIHRKYCLSYDSLLMLTLKNTPENTLEDLENIEELYREVEVLPREDTPRAIIFRRSPNSLLTAEESRAENQQVFATVSPFLIQKRFGEITQWTKEELRLGHHHPLIIIGTFHLLFLQTSPFQFANHRFALLLTSHLLTQNGFGFVEFSHFAPFLSARSRQYFNALRQAEKTALGNWSTLNLWLEFFFDSLLEASDVLGKKTAHVGKAGLTPVQKRILQVVKSEGPVSRNKIAHSTGINLSTVKYNLSVLSKKGRLARIGGGRTTSYRII